MCVMCVSVYVYAHGVGMIKVKPLGCAADRYTHSLPLYHPKTLVPIPPHHHHHHTRIHTETHMHTSTYAHTQRERGNTHTLSEDSLIAARVHRLVMAHR